MANSNVNIANKLYAYIKHGADISDEIKQVYNNSMIFIGDEKQIYVPVMDTYVGIGMTAYNATIDRISSVENLLEDLAKTLSTDLVSKVYANYSAEDITYLSENASTIGKMNDEDWIKNNWALNNEITLRGVNDYDPTTGLSRRNEDHHRYIYKASDGTEISIDKNSTDANYPKPYSTYSQATSGITITPHWGEERRSTNPVTGQTITKRYGNYLEIDDKLTWSYMTSAYAYTMNFAQKYTANEINRLYHNILGDSYAVYLPVSFKSAITNQTDLFTDLVAKEGVNALEDYNTKHEGKSRVIAVKPEGAAAYSYYVLDISKDYYYCYKTSVENPTDPHKTEIDKTYVKLTISDLESIFNKSFTPQPGAITYPTDEDADIENFLQLYVKDDQYNSSYNMNIADGIETLKEVAYLLDLLSDGGLGQVTYYTYAEWKTAAWDDTAHTYSIVPAGASAAGWQYISSDPNWKPKAKDTYAYYVKEVDPENLGIQIAYSISGNQIQINDLHDHAYLLETGNTTLRSIQSTSTNFAKVSLTGGTVEWADTDSKQGKSNFNDPDPEGRYTHPNRTVSNTREVNSYLVGDVNLKVDLITASTYATVNSVDGSANPYYKNNGVEWFGTYTAADMDAIDGSKATYYIKNGTEGTYTFEAVPVNELVTDSRLQASTLQYYWIPVSSDDDPSAGHAINDNNQNLVWASIKIKDLIAAGDDTKIYDKNGKSWTKSAVKTFYSQKVNNIDSVVGNTAGEINAAAEAIANYSSKNLTQDDYLYFVADTKDTVIHASYTSNGLTTTEWVSAYVDARVSDIADDLENILEEAKKYTDDEIDKLDSESIYADFSTYYAKYCNTHKSEEGKGDLAIEGSNLWLTTYAEQYNAFKQRWVNDHEIGLYGNADAGTTENPYRLSYVAESSVVFNVKEENGIVTAETRQLPADIIESDVKVWGSENNFVGERHEYEDITVEDVATSANVNEGNALLNSLFAWADANEDNQVFVKIADGAYEPVPTSEALSSIAGLYFIGNSDTTKYTTIGAYTDLAAIQNDTDIYLPVSDYANTNDRKWRQLYRKTDKYLELNLQDAISLDTSGNPYTNGTDQTLDPNKVKIGDFVLTLNGDKTISVSGTGVVASSKLQHIKTKAAASTKYLDVESKHYEFKDNGHGENKLKVTAHITKIEDATENNTGFADAFDVKSYIDNLFRWVNISASVSQSTINSNDVFHKNVSIDEWNGTEQLYNRTKSGDDVSFTKVANNTPSYGWFWLDDNTFYASATASDSEPSAPADPGKHISVKDKWFHKEFASKGTYDATVKYDATSNYYIEVEHAFTNPLNLSETKFKD